MNFEVFLFLLFMSFVSFAVGLIVWVAIARIFGRGTPTAKLLSYVLIPILVLTYNFLIIVSGPWRYAVGSLPLVVIVGYLLYYRFGNHGSYIEPQAPPPSDFKRRESAKSRKIHAAREKREALRKK